MLILREKVALFPTDPGIYQMYDADRKLIYIGKAKNLRNRVRSYFNSNLSRRITQVLVSKINFIDYILTKTEQEALILENNLIKQHQPFFNIDLKDNKSYPYLWLTTDDQFPSLFKTRILGQKGEYFGPYTEVSLMNTYLEVVNTLYPLKKCRKKSFPKNFKPCLYFHLGQCLDYCTGGVKKETVDQLSREITNLLKGRNREVIERLTEKMKEASGELNYERARHIKHYIEILSQLESQQSVTTINENSFDVINYHVSDQLMVVVVLQFRGGRLLHKNSYNFKSDLYEKDLSDELVVDTLEQFLFDYYSLQVVPIREIIVPPFFSKSDKNLIASLQQVIDSAYDVGVNSDRLEESVRSYLKQSSSFYPKMVTVVKGEKHRYLNLAEANARYSIQEILKNNEKLQFAKELREFLKLKKTPNTIESFDIANLSDQHIVAGMVRFINGEKDKENYRVFNIVGTETQNDFASMEEAVYRRYKRLLDEKQELPDLILIDGGKGQLNSAKKSLDRLGIRGQPIISLAKREEEIYVPKKSEPLPISIDHPALQFLVRVRDETHRFVNSRHVQKRSTASLKSVLSEIPGLGEKKITTLMNHFNSLQEIKLSSPESLCKLPFFGRKDADVLLEFLRNR